MRTDDKNNGRNNDSVVTGLNGRELIIRSIELYQNGGTREVIRGVSDFTKTQLARTPLYYKPEYYHLRDDNDLRWKFIQTHLDESDQTLLDIGCSEGYLTATAADSGLRATGIDIEQSRIEYAKHQWEENENLEFKQKEINLESIDGLPIVDVVLFLTVYHHWEREYGTDDANNMFKTIARISNKLYFEPPGNRFHNDQIDPDDSINKYTGLLNSIFGDSVEIINVTMVPRKEEQERSDPLFALDTSKY